MGTRGATTTMINGQQCERGGRNVQLRGDLQQVPHLLVKMLAGHCRQTEEVLPLPGPDDDGDARSETRDDGIGNELDDRPETRDAEEQQDHAGQQRRDLQPVDAVPGSNARQDDDERAGRTCNLQPTAPEHGNSQAGDDGRVEALLGFGPRSDRKRHRQRQRHDADDHAGNDVAQPVCAAQQARMPSLQQSDHSVDLPYLNDDRMLAADEPQTVALRRNLRGSP
jgi:hypothetical protein